MEAHKLIHRPIISLVSNNQKQKLKNLHQILKLKELMCKISNSVLTKRFSKWKWVENKCDFEVPKLQNDHITAHLFANWVE